MEVRAVTSLLRPSTIAHITLEATPMFKLAFLLGAVGFATTFTSPAKSRPLPTIVLVHGAFAESASWETVLARLSAKGYHVIAVPNPLRGPKADAAYVSAMLSGISGPIVLVGHSYGGTVITNAAEGAPQVKALVYVAAFAPDVGETAAGIGDRFPGATLSATLAPPITLADGNKELLIDQSKFPAQFAADVPIATAKLLAEMQRPISEVAFSEAAGPAAWKHIPSWFIYGTADRNIPEAALAFMAKRAGSKETVAVKGASHLVMVSHPDAVASIIERAAATVH
jgi:pimeloyl-ACP methyl ester carboxylesterase